MSSNLDQIRSRQRIKYELHRERALRERHAFVGKGVGVAHAQFKAPRCHVRHCPRDRVGRVLCHCAGNPARTVAEKAPFSIYELQQRDRPDDQRIPRTPASLRRNRRGWKPPARMRSAVRAGVMENWGVGKMNTWVPTFLGGIAVGVAVAAPIGPMGLFCIQRTIASGASAGLSIGLAAATVHVAYSVAALAGLGIVAPSWSEGGSWAFSLLSAALLFWFGARALCRKAAVCPGVIPAPCGPVRSFGGALLLALTNPLTALLFAAAMPVFAGAELPLSGPPIIVGVFVGSFGWWVALTSVVAALRSRLDSRSLVFANKGAALVLVGLGTVVMTQAIRLAAP